MRRYAAIATGLALSLASSAVAQQPQDARRATVVAHVGDKSITVGELEDRMAQVPPYQLASFGDTPAKRGRKFLEQVMVPDLLCALGARDRHVDTRLPTSYLLDHARSDAAIRGIKKSVTPAARLPAQDVKQYYDENKSRYDSPERYNLWRILTASRAEALTVLAAARKDPALTTWNSLARDHSLDKATAMRGGNLGFVTLDGTSNEAGLHVDPAIVSAATRVKDGEFVSEIVSEGANFAVIWRRGTVGASHRPLGDVEAQIRDTLFKQRSDAEAKRVTDDARSRLLKDFNPALLDMIDVSLGDAQIIPRKRPGQVPPASSSQSP
jgi:peptidyl-prolyl cis-trans isomerase C